jgi:hypothetical protein
MRAGRVVALVLGERCSAPRCMRRSAKRSRPRAGRVSRWPKPRLRTGMLNGFEEDGTTSSSRKNL